LLSRDRQPVMAIGWVRWRAWREAGLGLVLSIPITVGAQLLATALQGAGLSGPPSGSSSGQPSTGLGDLVLATLLVAVVAISEETIFRGYLILRFSSLWGR